MDINRILSGKPVIFEGFLLRKKAGSITIQLHPGLTIDVKENACESVEEAADEVTGKTYVKITLRHDADINATFQPRLARLALKQGATGVPFTMGGLPQGVRSGPVYLAPRLRGGGGGIGGGGGGLGYDTDTWGEFSTRSYVWFWGWCDDDTTYNDTSTDNGISIG